MSGNRRTIGNTFVVTTMEDPVSVVAQYAPNNNPSNSQIHTTFQSGDLFMRTRNTDESFSGNVDPNHPWNRIVGEAGDETDYTFAISAQKTTANASTSPTDIGANDWSDAPVATTQAKPYLWSSVKKKVWDETQTPPAYVVQSTKYIRLTGEGGEEYIIESTQGSVVIESNQTTGTLSGVTLSFFRKEGGKEREAYSCFCTIFRKKGSTYTAIKLYSNAGAAVTYTHTTGTGVPSLTADNYDAIVVCIYNAANTSHSGYLAELEIPVHKNGDDSRRVDLDNEHEDFLYDDAGNRKSAIVTSQARLYNGSAQVAAGITWAVSCDNGATWVDQGDTYTSGNAKAKISSGGLLTVEEIYVTTAKIRVRAFYDNKYYYTEFTANKQTQDKYDIQLTPNSIPYNPANYSTVTVGISAKRTSIAGGAPTDIAFGAYDDKTKISNTNGKGYLRVFAPVRTEVAQDTFDYVPTQIISGFVVNSTYASERNGIYFQLRRYDDCDTSDDNGSYGVLVDWENIPICKSVNGTSPYFADLDNEMDSIACANDGKPSSEQTVETNVKLYRGSNELSPTIAVNDDSPSGAAYTSGTAKDDITVTWNSTTGNIKFKFGTAIVRTKTETFCITLSVIDSGTTITRYLYFTVNCIRAALDGTPATLYRLVPSVNEIVKKKDGTSVPSANEYITCSVTKNVGGTQSTPAASEYLLTYSLDGGSTETEYTSQSLGVQVLDVISNLIFTLYVPRTNGTDVDKETIGRIQDGNDGDDAEFYKIDTDIDSVVIPSDQSSITLSTAPKAYFKKVKGSTESSQRMQYAVYWRSGSSYTQITSYPAGQEKENISLPTQYSSSYDALVIFGKVGGQASSTNYDAKKEVLIIKSGNTGQPGAPGTRGKMGRSYYYAAEWNPNDNTTSFLVDDAQAPFFSNAGSNLNKYYIFNSETNGYYTMYQMAVATTVSGNIDWNSAPWALMTDDFKYIITEALFTKFAKLGSAIFNQDFMYSKYLNNELSMYYSYSGQSIVRSISNDYALLVSQTSLPVVEGKQYKISITCYHNGSYSDALYSRVYYNTKSDWSGTSFGSSAFIGVGSDTENTYNIDFVAVQTGYVRIYNCGYGTIKKIAASQSESYEKVSPMFINTDDVPLLTTGGVATTSTSSNIQNVVNTAIPVIYGRRYDVTFDASISAGGAGYVCIYSETGSLLGSTTITYSSLNPDVNTYTLTIDPCYHTGNAYLKFYVENSSYTLTLTNVYIKCPNAFVPQAIVDWLTGYAHFSGDRVRFNPDGSGHLANKNVSWDAQGNASFNGIVEANLMYSKQKTIMSTVYSTYNVDLVNEPANLFVVKAITRNVTIVLPNAGTYDGMTIRFYSSSSSNYWVKVKDVDSNNIYFKDQGNYVAGSWQSSALVEFVNNESYTVAAIDGTWFLTVGVAKFG